MNLASFRSPMQSPPGTERSQRLVDLMSNPALSDILVRGVKCAMERCQPLLGFGQSSRTFGGRVVSMASYLHTWSDPYNTASPPVSLCELRRKDGVLPTSHPVSCQ